MDDPELHKQNNHWVIGISHIDYAPSLDMVFAVHVPSGQYQISGRRRQIFSRKDLMEPIEFVYDFMLTFTKHQLRHGPGPQHLLAGELCTSYFPKLVSHLSFVK